MGEGKRAKKKITVLAYGEGEVVIPGGVERDDAANPDASSSALAGAAWSWTGSFPVAEDREARCGGGGGLLLCRIGARWCGTTDRWWAVAAAAMVGGRAAAGEGSCCGGSSKLAPFAPPPAYPPHISSSLRPRLFPYCSGVWAGRRGGSGELLPLPGV